MRTSAVLVALASALVVALAHHGGLGHHGMSEHGGGSHSRFWSAFQRAKSWLGGVAEAADPILSPNCCAMARDGSYFAKNLSAIVDLGDGITPYFGYWAASTPTSEYTVALGGSTPEDSDFGWYLRPSSSAADSSSLTATAWCAESQECEDYEFPSDAATPDACFGDDTLWPRVVSTSRVDAMLTSNNYASEDENAFMAVNRMTCMPLYSLHRFKDDGSGAPTASKLFNWRRLRDPSKLKSPAPADDESWAVMLFLNASGTAPTADDGVFGVPSYCEDKAAARRAKPSATPA